VSNWLVTMGGSRYDRITEQFMNKGAEYGFDRLWIYDDVYVNAHPFRKLNAWLWDASSHCFGYCAWKPLIILDALDHAAPGDVVFYVDGDCRPVASLAPVFDYTRKHGAMFFASSAHMNHRWCKRDCFIAMGQDDLFGRTDMQAGCARFCAFRRGHYPSRREGSPLEEALYIDDWRERQFIFEWLTYSVNRIANTKAKSTHGTAEDMYVDRHGGDWEFGPLEHPQFEEHRDEQAIMTLLCHKYGYPLHRECDQYGADWVGLQPGDYPQLFEQTHLGTGHPVEGSRFRRTP